MPDFAYRLAGLLAQRNDTLFGVPGGGPNLDLVGAAVGAGMRFVLARGETAAGIMASTYGLLTGSPAAVVVTRGPGAASVVNGAAQATLDRFPSLIVTDTVVDVQRSVVGHQQIDQRAMMAPVSVASVVGCDALSDGELASVLDRAGTWPMGAVHVNYDPECDPGETPISPSAEQVRAPLPSLGASEVAGLVSEAQRPVVLVGMEAAAEEYRALPERPISVALSQLGCPVLTTYQAVGVVDTEGPLFAGLFTGGSMEQELLDGADLVLAVGFDPVEPMPNPWRRTVPVVTLSSAKPSHRFFPDPTPMFGPVAEMLVELVDNLGERGWSPSWPADTASGYRSAGRERLGAERPGGFGPMDLLDAALSAMASIDGPATVTVDAGAHFLALMPNVPADEPFRVLISNGLATMGFSLPAAVAAALARPGEPVVAFVGDGGLAMCQAELETVARLNLPITVVVFNDAAFTLIGLKQRPEHGDLSSLTYGATDYAAVARANGVHGLVASSASELEAHLLGDPGWFSPRLVDARIDPAHYRHIIDVSRG